MALLAVQNLTKSFVTRLLFEGVSFEVNPRDKIGLIGVNGCGKTTLFRILTGEEPHDGGSVFQSKDARIGVMAQSISDTSQTVYQSALSAFETLLGIEKELEALYRALMKPYLKEKEAMALAARQQSLYSRYEAGGGLTYKSRARSMLLSLGFREEELSKPLSAMSGGQRNKVQLARLLLSEANLLLLDEPTNHLDIDATAFLEEYLIGYPGAVIVISHDRYFLDRVTNRTFEIANQRLYVSEGNYTRHMELRASAQELIRRRYMRAQKEIRRIEQIVEQQRRWGQAHNFVTAASKLKQIERIKAEMVEPEREPESIRFRFTVKRNSGNDVLMCKNLSKAYEKQVFSNVSLHIKKGERVFLLGLNGCGKTTLLRIIMGLETPDTGEVRLGANVHAGYYAQHMTELDDNNTAIEEVWAQFPRLNTTQIRTAMAAFLFKGDDIEKRVEMLSGGERARLQLLKLMLAGENLLLLDEPTNHLDIPSREALEAALEEYEGTMLIVTHDRYLVNRLADRVIVMKPDGLEEYAGGYDDYLTARAELNRQQAAEEKPPVPLSDYARKKQRQSAINHAKGEVRRAEERIAAAESELSAIEAKLNAPETASDYTLLEELSRKAARQQERIDRLYAEWEEAMNRLSALESGEQAE